MGVAWLITRKDLRQRLRDRSVLLIVFVVPLALSMIFNLALGDLIAEETPDMRVAVVTSDADAFGVALRDAYLPGVAALFLEDGTNFDITSLADERDVADHLDAGDIDVGIVVPEGSTEALLSGQDTEVLLLTREGAPIAEDIVAGLMEQFSAQVAGELAAQSMITSTGLPTADAQALLEALRTVDARVGLVRVPISDEPTGLDVSTRLIAGMAVFFLFFTVQYGVLSYLDEQREGTLDRLLSGPIQLWQVQVGKLLTSAVMGVASVTVLLLVSIPLLGAHFRHPLGAGLLVLTVVATATSMVAVVTAVARTPEQASNAQTVIAIVLGFLGGAFFPLDDGPGLLLVISKVSPHAWFLRGMEDLAAGDGLSALVVPIGAMLTLAVVVTALGVMSARRRQGA